MIINSLFEIGLVQVCLCTYPLFIDVRTDNGGNERQLWFQWRCGDDGSNAFVCVNVFCQKQQCVYAQTQHYIRHALCGVWRVYMHNTESPSTVRTARILSHRMINELLNKIIGKGRKLHEANGKKCQILPILVFLWLTLPLSSTSEPEMVYNAMR